MAGVTLLLHREMRKQTQRERMVKVTQLINSQAWVLTQVYLAPKGKLSSVLEKDRGRMREQAGKMGEESGVEDHRRL